MPTYSYQCKECGEAFDAVQSFSDDPLTVCPNCGGPLRKLFNSVGVVFKGSGFYRTDSRSSKADTTAKTETKSSSDTAAKVDKATSSGSSTAS